MAPSVVDLFSFFLHSTFKTLFFKYSFTESIHFFRGLLTNSLPPYIHLAILSFSILSVWPNHWRILSLVLSFTHFATPHSSVIRTFGTSSILLIRSKPLEVVHLRNPNSRLILFSPYHCLTAMQQDRHEQFLMQTSSINQGLMAPTTFHPTATFLQHCSICNKTHPKYLNSDTCSNHASNTHHSDLTLHSLHHLTS